MSNISNFRKDKVDLPIGSLKQVITGNNITNAANTTSLVDNGLWIPVNTVYAKSAYPELFSQLGQLSAIPFNTTQSMPIGYGIYDAGQPFRIVYGNGLYVLGGPVGFSTSTNLVNWTLRGTGTTSSITDIAYGNNLYVYGGFGGVVGTSTDKLNWTIRTSGTTSTIYAMEYGTGLFVLAGTGGMIRTSTDGITWAAATSGTAQQLNDVIYNNGLFIYVGNAGVLSTSTNGITWTARTSGTASAIFDITYGNGLYLIAGNGGMIRSSTDGITWDTRTSGTTVPLYSAGYGNGYYIIAGGDGFSSNGLRTSTNLVTWTALASDFGGSDTIFNVGFYKGSYYYGGSLFWNYNRGFLNPISPSYFHMGSRLSYQTTGSIREVNGELFVTDRSGGLTFTNVAFSTSGDESFFTPVFSSYGGLSYSNGLFIDNGGQTGIIFTSNNGLNWTQTDLFNTEFGSNQGDFEQMYRTNYTNGIYYSLSSTGTLYTSTDGYTWNGKRNIGNSLNAFFDISYGNGEVVYFLNQSVPLRNKNVQGRLTTTRKPLANIVTPNLVRSTYGNGLFVYAGADGTLRTSTDSVTWFTRSSGTTSTILTLTYGNGIYLYGANNGVLASSTDGTTWTARTSGTTSSILALTYGNGIYVYGANNGALASSTDGTTWTARTSGTTSSILTLTYGNSTYVYAGDGGVLATSTDGTTWTARTSGTTEGIRALTYGNGTFVYAGNNSTIASSTNAITWVARNSGSLQKPLHRLLYANGTFYCLGADGRTYFGTSTDGITWAPFSCGIAIGSARPVELTYYNGEYVLAYQDPAEFPLAIRFKVTTDFNTWTQKYGEIFNVVVGNGSRNRIVYGNGYYVMLTNNNICVSKDFIKWYTPIQTPANDNLLDLTYSNGTFTVLRSGFIMVCSSNQNPIYSESWTRITYPSSIISKSLANNEYIFVSGLAEGTPTKKYVATANPQSLTLASYDTANNFYVPAFTNQGTFTVTTGTIPIISTFIKAKM